MTTMASSTASPTVVIVSGSNVLTWECLKRDAQAQSLHPHGETPIADATWNHNGHAVSTDVEVHNNVILTAAESGTRLDSLQHNQNWTRKAGVGTSVAFGGNSRYLTVGDESGAVCMWDLKKRTRVRQFFHDGYASRQVSVDPSDTFVLSLSHAFLSVYNLREGNLSTTLDPPDRHMSFTRFHTSPLEPEKTAIGTRDGSVLVYDIHQGGRNAPLLTLDRRQSDAISGVSFSAVNSKLLASSSIDGTLQFFDMRSGQTIQQLASLSAPITSLSMHPGGINCAVGTHAGEVLVYDLRQSSPISSMITKGRVTSLQFAPIPKPRKEKKTAASSSASKSKPFMNSARIDDDEPMRRPNAEDSALQPMNASRTLSNSSGPSTNYFEPESAVPKSYYGPPESKPSATANSPSWTSGKENQSSSNTKSATKEDKPDIRESRLSSSMESKYSLSKSNEEKKAPEPRIKMDEVRDIVKDEVENLRDDIEEAIRNLHMDMISQFHQQSQELNTVLTAQNATIDRLTDENRRLQEENAKLREERSSSLDGSDHEFLFS
eukprot:scaffold3556_cov190-Cylindrotheca_fusiformis.AAC.24